jgi:hypothetical protein
MVKLIQRAGCEKIILELRSVIMLEDSMEQYFYSRSQKQDFCNWHYQFTKRKLYIYSERKKCICKGQQGSWK